MENFKKFTINVYTNWCGESNDFGAIAKSEEELYDTAQSAAFENFQSFSGIEGVLEEMFGSEEDYTPEQFDEACEVEGEYYGFTIEEFEADEEEWEYYDIIYDGREL